MDGLSNAANGKDSNEIDGWLRDGGLVVAASDRAARALRLEFHRRRRAEGLAAWPAPEILDWASFIDTAWKERTLDGRMLLNPAQERLLWAGIAGRENHLATSLEGPLYRMAAMAVEAHRLLCSHAPRYLQGAARSGWDQDAAAFSRWLSAFDDTCRDAGLLSAGRVPLELVPLLQADASSRPPLLVAGFDRLLPVQRDIFDAWGAWREATPGAPAPQFHYYIANSSQAELDACALWCSRRLASNPAARLLVITQEIRARRGEIERAFLRYTPSASAPQFEFSLGIPLSQLPLARAALLLLRWLDGSMDENALDWLLSTGLTASGPEESADLQAFVRALRRKSLQRTQWTLTAFLNRSLSSSQLPEAWRQRMTSAKSLLANHAARRQSPLDWASLVPQLLQAAGLPGERRLSSAEYQAFHRWEQAIDTCGSLGFNGLRMPWSEFLSSLSRTLDETLFAPESSDAPIQITGPAESAGLSADAIWFLGADEDTWPSAGSTHPLLPLAVQRQAAMPHALPRQDWDLAEAITKRLLAAAPIVHFSFAAQKGEIEARPSRLVAQIAGPPQPVPAELLSIPLPPFLTEPFDDFSSIVFPSHRIQGGSSVLTSQSQCPFKAFATARLGAQGWEPAEVGLTASQRGQLLHSVLSDIWSEPPHEQRTLQYLQSCQNLDALVAGHVQRVLRLKVSDAVREDMPPHYLALEEQRLTRLVKEWLQYEAARLPFTVEEIEAEHTISVAGLSLKLRLDRIDRLSDGSALVIDYKTGDVSPREWELPRPDDVQLPLYAGFALSEEPGGLVFAKVRTGHIGFTGLVRDAKATLSASLNGNSALARNKLTPQQMEAWKEYITTLAHDFIAGRAEVDPRDYPGTCERCGLQSLCRVQEEENRVRCEAPDESGGEAESSSEEATHD